MLIHTLISTETADPSEVINQQVAAINGSGSPYPAPAEGCKQFVIPAYVAPGVPLGVAVCEDAVSTAASWLTVALNNSDDESIKAAIAAQV